MRGWITDGVYYKNEDESNRLKMGGGSWTVNMEECPEDIDAIEYRTFKGTYRISGPDARSVGFFRMLMGERKLVIPVSKWAFQEGGSCGE